MAAKLLGDTKSSTAAMELWVALSDDSHVFLARLERVPGWDGSRGESSLAPAVRARLIDRSPVTARSCRSGVVTRQWISDARRNRLVDDMTLGRGAAAATLKVVLPRY